MTRRYRIFAVVAAAALMGFCAPSATALDGWSSWGTLRASGNSGTGVGYGSWAVERTLDGTKYSASYKVRFSDPATSSRGVYIVHAPQSNSGYCVSASASLDYKFVGASGSYSCSKQFYSEGSSSGVRRTAETYNANYYHNRMNPNWNASTARGRVKVCLDLKLKADPCSGYNASKPDTY